MATVLCAWEIGDGHGHVRNLLAVAALLRAAGHRAVFVLPSSQVTAAKLVEAAGWPVERLLMPPHPSTEQYLPPFARYRAASFLDVMGLHAFDNADRLGHALARYAIAMRQHRVDAVLAESAPVAMLAARVARVPCLAVGTSFGLPELRQGFAPYPQLDQWPNTPIFTDAALLATTNKATGRAFTSMADALMPARIVPFCYPALDHYGDARSLTHRGVGPIWTMKPQTPVRELRGFAYLQSAYPAINELVSAIRSSGIPFTVYVRNGKFSSSTSMQVVNAFHAEHELSRAAMVLHHGSTGLGQAALGAGIAQMCFPYHIENTNNAYRLQMLGVSKAIGHGQAGEFLGFLLDSNDHRADAARVIAAQLDAHAWEFPGAKVAAAALDDLL